MCDCCRLHAAVKLTRVVYVTTTPSFMKLIGMLLLTLSAVSAALNNRLISLYHCYHCVQWFILIFEFDFSLLLLLLLYYNTITEYYNNIILLLYKHKTYFASTIHHQVVYYLHCGTKNFLHLFSVLLPSTREEVYVFAHVCLSVCLWARLLEKACIDVDEILHVDRCRDMDELISFWAHPYFSLDAGTGLLSPILYNLRNFAALPRLPASCAATWNFTSGMVLWRFQFSKTQFGFSFFKPRKCHSVWFRFSLIK